MLDFGYNNLYDYKKVVGDEVFAKLFLGLFSFYFFVFYIMVVAYCAKQPA